MELEESAEQLSLKENQFICTQLDYPAIVSPLIQAGIVTQEQNGQIQEAFVDNAGRMQELISVLIKSNSKTSFDVFREALQQLGESMLAEKLLRDQSSFEIPLNAEDAHPCLFLPEVLSHILSYLTKNDLMTVRLVCKTWNAVITACHMHKFTTSFWNYSGDQRMVEFVSTGSKSAFFKHLNRFSFDIWTMAPAAWVFYKTFFVIFGPKIQYLELGGGLDKDLLAFIFSPEIKECLKSLKHLELHVIPDEGLIQTDSLLTGLETLAITEFCTKSLVKCFDFLEKLLEVGRKLKVLRLNFNLALGTPIDKFPKANTILPKLSALENLVLKGLTVLDENWLRLLTFPNGEGRLKVINVELDNHVNPRVFKDFIASHRNTLRNINIIIVSCDNPLALMEVLPRVEHLNYLRRYAGISGGLFGDSISCLQFCTRAPNLKSLEIHYVGSQINPPPVPQPTFVHEGLKELRLGFDDNNCTADGILGFLNHVPQHFPNLMKLEVHARNVGWPAQLEYLQLQPGSCHTYKAVWNNTST